MKGVFAHGFPTRKANRVSSSMKLCRRMHWSGLMQVLELLESAGIWDVISRALEAPWKLEFYLKDWSRSMKFVNVYSFLCSQQ